MSLQTRHKHLEKVAGLRSVNPFFIRRKVLKALPELKAAKKQREIEKETKLTYGQRRLQALENQNAETIAFVENAPPVPPPYDKSPAGKLWDLVQETPEPFVKASSLAFHNELLIRLAAHSGL